MSHVATLCTVQCSVVALIKITFETELRVKLRWSIVSCMVYRRPRSGPPLARSSMTAGTGRNAAGDTDIRFELSVVEKYGENALESQCTRALSESEMIFFLEWVFVKP